MTEYSLDFSKSLITAAKHLSQSNSRSVDSRRAVLYLSLLSCEISLKALLESAGYPVNDIKALSHNLSALLSKVGTCKVMINGNRVPAARLRSIVSDEKFPDSTVGKLLTAEKYGASKYPNNIRYGDLLRHFPADAMLSVAEKVFEWSKENYGYITK